MATAVSLRLPEDVKKHLDKLSRRNGRSKTFYMVEAITEKIEELEDFYLAEQIARRVRAGKEKTWSLNHVKSDCRLHD